MKVRVNLGNVQVEAEGSTMVDVYEELAKLEEVFASQSQCRLCKNKLLRHRVRKDEEKHKYYELVCLNSECRATFRFGVSNENKGDLFPQWKKGKGKNKVLKDNGGWEKYTPKDAAGESEA